MASLKDLIVTGATRLIGDAYVNKIQITAISAPTASNGTTYSTGSSGQVLKSNGTSIYWSADDNSQTVTGVKGNSESSYRTGNVNITAANIGLGNVENTKLSTWAGSGNITTIGTLSSGTVPWARLSGVPDGATKTGTVTSVGTGVGLTGGSITGSGTIKAKLRSETALTNDSAAATETSGRVYPVAVDKSGYLAVNVPWTNINSSYLTSHQTVTNKGATLSWGATSTIATIGSTDIKVTMPANPNTNTDTLVTQTATTTNSAYEVLFSATADNTTRTETARKNSNLTFNPSTGNLTVTQINGVAVGSSPKFTDTWTAMVGATSSANGSVGYVNAAPPKDGYNTKYLRADGTWAVPPDTGDTHHTAYLRAGASGGTSNAATTTGNTYLNLVENGANRSGVKLAPGSNMSIMSDANGVVTFTATDTTYSSKTAASGGTDVSLVTTGEKYTWNNKSNLAIGTTASTAAAGNHTHSIALTTDTGTSAITLAHGEKYKLSAGGSNIIFTMPADNNTTYTAGTGIDLSNGVFSLATITGLTAGTYGPSGSTTTLTPSHGGTFTVPSVYVDTYGRVTSVGNYTVKLPSDADTKVKQTVSSTNANYKLLFTTTASPTSGTAYGTYYDSAITVNPSTDTITATTFVGKMSKGITIGGKTYNGSSDIIINSSDLGLTSPMTFKGVSTTNLSDGATTSPIALKGGTSLTPAEGDVVLDSVDNEEYIWSGNKWNAMGIASSYAMAQHTHGNIANNGTLDSDVTIANGDKIAITDASDSNKIARASISFNGSTTTKALSQKGTWESFLPISGGTLTGNVTLNKVTGSSANYGDTLPSTGSEGQLFFKVGGVESKIDTFYPVGSIYMSVNSANPGTLFGGTWERIQDCFLLAAGSAYSAGSTGGEATHILTESEMPAHAHVMGSFQSNSNQTTRNYLTLQNDGNVVVYTSDNVVKWSANSAQTSGSNAIYHVGSIGPDGTTGSTGGGNAHNNIPPYLAVYVWKRVS